VGVRISGDIFSHKVWTWHGPVEHFVLFFIEMGTRKIRFFNVTDHPNARWMTQQARNFCTVCEEEGLHPHLGSSSSGCGPGPS